MFRLVIFLTATYTYIQNYTDAWSHRGSSLHFILESISQMFVSLSRNPAKEAKHEGHLRKPTTLPRDRKKEKRRTEQIVAISVSRINRETKRFRVEVDGKEVDPIEGIIERGWKIKVPSNKAADLGVDPACCGKERQSPRASFSTYNNREASNIAIATTTIGTRYSVGTTTTAAFCPSSFSFTPPTPSPATVPSSSEGWLTFPQEEHGSQARSILPTYPSRLSPLLPRPVFSDTPIPTGWLAPRCILNQSPGGNAITRHHDASTIFYFKLLYVLVLPPPFPSWPSISLPPQWDPQHPQPRSPRPPNPVHFSSLTGKPRRAATAATLALYRTILVLLPTATSFSDGLAFQTQSFTLRQIL